MEHSFGWLEWLSEHIALGVQITSGNVHIATATVVLLLLAAASLTVWRRVRQPAGYLIPDDRLSITTVFDVIVNAVLEMMEDIIGPSARKHLPLIGSIFIYILVSNLLGLLPGMAPSTSNMNTNLAVSLVVFVYYNYVGICEQGIGNYLKHFMGPVIWIAPLLFAIELLSHLIRPMTLSIRLFCNMVADHAVVGVFSDLVPLVVPAVFMGLGLFISLLQAFVFSLLSMVYIALAIAHEEHH